MTMSKYRRRTYIVNKKVQLRLTFFVTFAILLSSVALSVGAYCAYFSVIVAKIGIVKAADYGLNLKSFIGQFPLPIILQLIMLILVSIGFGIYSIFLSHRIIGPLVRLKRAMIELKEKGYTERITIRKGDYLTELIDIFNDMAAAVENKLRKNA